MVLVALGLRLDESMRWLRDEFATSTDLSDRHDHDVSTNQTHRKGHSLHGTLIGDDSPSDTSIMSIATLLKRLTIRDFHAFATKT